MIAGLAARCGLATDRLALGMLQLATETTAGVVRRQTMERGLDPASFTMIVSRRRRPGQACAVADAVGIGRVLIPPFPGHFSAFGMLQSDLRFTRQELVELPLESLPAPELRARVARLARQLEHVVANASRFAGSTASEVSLALRYAGQDHFLRMPVAAALLASGERLHAEVARDFASRYERRYGYADGSSGVEIIDIEVVARKDLPPARVTAADAGGVPAARAIACLFDETDGFVPVQAAHRATLAREHVTAGPLLIYETGSITVVPPGWAVEVIQGNHMALTRIAA